MMIPPETIYGALGGLIGGFVSAYFGMLQTLDSRMEARLDKFLISLQNPQTGFVPRLEAQIQHMEYERRFAALESRRT